MSKKQKNTLGSEWQFTLCAYPRDDQYCNQFYMALEKYNVMAFKGELGFRWILKNKHNFNALHFHWPSFYYGGVRIISIFKFYLFLTFAKMLGKKILWTVHNLYPHHIIHVKKLDYLCRILMVFFSDLLFVHGITSKETLLKEFPLVRNKKICIIEHGNYLERYPNKVTAAEAKKKLGISSSDFVYLSFGKANPYKGLEDLIKAYKLVTDGKDKLIIAGRFPNKNYLKKIKQKIHDMGGLSGNVKLVDRRIEDDEIQIFLNAADIMVLPYKYKSVLTSGIALFALSFGLAIVAPRIGYFNDLICDNGLGVLYEKSSSISELCDSMRMVKKMSFDRDAIIEHVKRYDWDIIGQKAYDCLREHFWSDV